MIFFQVFVQLLSLKYICFKATFVLKLHYIINRTLSNTKGENSTPCIFLLRVYTRPFYRLLFSDYYSVIKKYSAEYRKHIFCTIRPNYSAAEYSVPSLWYICVDLVEWVVSLTLGHVPGLSHVGVGGVYVRWCIYV